jgi:hypothetical protein
MQHAIVHSLHYQALLYLLSVRLRVCVHRVDDTSSACLCPACASFVVVCVCACASLVVVLVMCMRGVLALRRQLRLVDAVHTQCRRRAACLCVRVRHWSLSEHVRARRPGIESITTPRRLPVCAQRRQHAACLCACTASTTHCVPVCACACTESRLSFDGCNSTA